MVHVNMKNVILFLLPPLLSLSYVVFGAWWLLILAAAALYAAVGLLPCFHGRETSGVFLLGFLTILPVNAVLARDFSAYFEDYPAFVRFIDAAAVFLALTGAEEIVLALLSRLLWRRQQ